jgi:hypothetical protein
MNRMAVSFNMNRVSSGILPPAAGPEDGANPVAEHLKDLDHKTDKGCQKALI